MGLLSSLFNLASPGTAKQKPAQAQHPKSHRPNPSHRPAKSTARRRSAPPVRAGEQGRRVFSASGEPVQLAAAFARGGEGTIHRIESMPGKVVKIYNDAILSDPGKAGERREKIQAMCGMDGFASDARFCWPRIPVFDDRRRWIGYAMREAKGKPAHLLCSLYTVTTEFPGWDRRELLEAVIAIATGMRKLHAKGVLLGDVSTGNILVDPAAASASFVDCDSYHVRSGNRTFPCRVRTMQFSPPEVIRKSVPLDHLTEEQERFSAAVLFFHILMGGLHPYNHIGGGSPMENIAAGRCALGKGSDARFPKGPWFNIWSHLPYQIKSLFIRTFRDGHSSPNLRPGLGEWAGALRKYRTEMLGAGFHDPSLLPEKPKSSEWKSRKNNPA